MPALEFGVDFSKTKTYAFKIYFREKNFINPGVYVFIFSSAMKSVAVLLHLFFCSNIANLMAY